VRRTNHLVIYSLAFVHFILFFLIREYQSGRVLSFVLLRFNMLFSSLFFKKREREKGKERKRKEKGKEKKKKYLLFCHLMDCRIIINKKLCRPFLFFYLFSPFQIDFHIAIDGPCIFSVSLGPLHLVFQF
jgi:hypothetical protein